MRRGDRDVAESLLSRDGRLFCHGDSTHRRDNLNKLHNKQINPNLLDTNASCTLLEVELVTDGDIIVVLTAFAVVARELLELDLVIERDSLDVLEEFLCPPLAVIGAVVLATLSRDAPPGSFVDEG